MFAFKHEKENDVLEVEDSLDGDDELCFSFKTEDMEEPENFYLPREAVKKLYTHLGEVLKLRF